MDDQRPISAAEEAFFKLETGGGKFIVFYFLVWYIFYFSSARCGDLHQVWCTGTQEL